MSESEKKFFYKLYINVLKYRKTKPGFALKFFIRTTVNLSKSILYEPPDWSNYVAYVLRFDNNLWNKDNIKYFIRLSPMILVNKDMNEEAIALIERLYLLDMDLVKDKDISLLKDCFLFWKEGRIPNQPIKGTVRRDDELIYTIGHKTFNDAIQDWKNLLY